jgi:hypothetical protein
LETGSSLNYLWIARNSDRLNETQYNYMISNNYQDWISDAIKNYKNVYKVLSLVANKQIINHDIIEKGVVKTTYGNGLKITINYNNYPITYNNQIIQPQDYFVSEN